MLGDFVVMLDVFSVRGSAYTSIASSTKTIACLLSLGGTETPLPTPRKERNEEYLC